MLAAEEINQYKLISSPKTRDGACMIPQINNLAPVIAEHFVSLRPRGGSENLQQFPSFV